MRSQRGRRRRGRGGRAILFGDVEGVRPAVQDSRFWVVDGDNDEIFFQRITEDGDPEGLEVRLTSSPEASMGPSIAWNETDYAVAWTELLPGANHEIYFRHVTADGELTGNAVRLTDDPGESTNVSIVWADGEYGVVWEEDEGVCDGDRTGISGSCFMRVSLDGEVLSERRIDDGSSYARFPRLHWTGSQYIFLWSDWRHSQFELFYTMRDADGVRLMPDTRITDARGDSIGGSMAKAGAEMGILFTDRRDGNHEVYFTSLTCDTESAVED